MHTADSIVFVVTADADLRLRLEGVARSGGFATVAFATVAAHLAYRRPDVPACHVLDVALTDMNGLALQASLAVTGVASVVFITRQADVAFSARALKSGALDFLTTSVADAVLLAAIESALGHARERHLRQERITMLQQRWSQLTTREREVLQLVVSGCLNKQVGAALGISEITVKAHRGRVMAKMLADSFADLVRMASELELPLIAARHTAHQIGIGRQWPAALCA